MVSETDYWLRPRSAGVVAVRSNTGARMRRLVGGRGFSVCCTVPRKPERTREMTDEATEREFRKIADVFIDIANEQIGKSPKENVGMALLFAASRFNAFVVASHCKTLDRYEADRDRAIEFFSKEYLRMLEENLEDYRRAFGGE